MSEILNPYIAGAPVTEASMFFGREDVFSWIERSLEGKYIDHILVLHGQRRVGKTSVLKQIPNFLPNRYIQVFFDLQGRTNTTLDRFMWWMAREISRTLKQEIGIAVPRPNRDDFAADPEYLINDFLPNLRPILEDRVLLLTFDEFDTLDRDEIQESFSRPLITYLRRMMELNSLSFIFSIGSSGDKLENMQASYTDFFKSALYRKISFLTRDDCYRLVTIPVEGVIEYGHKAIDQIYEITSGHPYFTQLLCHELFSLCQKTGARSISTGDVQSVLDDVIERGTVNLKFVWDEASALEKWVLAGLAQMDGRGTTRKLSQLLREQRVRFSESDLNSAVIHLQDKDVLTQDNQFVIRLMQMWLQVNRPLDRVREELDEVNPIANRYIEIGDEYRDMGQAEQAVESYQQALSSDPGNLKAQSSIGSVRLEALAYQEAAAAFELALQIDDEDVVALTGFCDASLALGDQSRAEGEMDAAIVRYQKILVINPAHVDARQRLADIYTARAEDFLVAGQDDEALSAFNQALNFTPEDDRLASRNEEVLTQKRARVVAEWLSKAERSLSRQRWDEAAGYVEEALKLDPDSADLQAKLIEVKDAPRQFKLREYKREAEQAIQRGNFGKAIAAIETAIQLAPEDKSLVDWLESARTDQLNARLNLFLDQAQKALATGDWDAAIDAYRQAARLAPDDPTWGQKIRETESARLQAQLDAYQKQAEEAVSKGQWETAIQAIQKAIDIAPEAAPWRAKLAEIEMARHQVQLKALRAEADAARSAGNWEAAIAALESYQQLEPDETKIQAEINVIRMEKRDSELANFKVQAKKATQAEKWGEAVVAWEGYLALEPSDQTEVEETLQHARKFVKISDDYTDAQQAIRKKRYGRAIALLQGIIAQDPTYKSTSRLLVEAVEANKAIPIWRRPWVFPALGALALIALGAFFGPGLFNALSTAAGDELVQTETVVAGGKPEDVIEPTSLLLAPVITSTPAPTFTEGAEEPLLFPTPTETHTPASTEIPTPTPEPTSALYEHIYQKWPSFQDRFYTYKENLWGFLGMYRPDINPQYSIIADGALHLVGIGQKFLFPAITPMRSTDFAVQYELAIGVPISSVARDSFTGFQFRTRGDMRYYYDFRYYPGDERWQCTKSFTGFTVIDEGEIAKEKFTLRIIAYGDSFAIFIDGEPICTFQDSDITGEENYFFLDGGEDLKIVIDNLKYWNLDGVEIGAQETPTPTPTPTEETSAFYEPILAYIDQQWPVIQDSFDTVNRFLWGSLGLYSPDINPEDEIIADGALHLVGGHGYKIWFPSGTQMRSTDFAVEYELAIGVPNSSVNRDSYRDSFTGYQFRTTENMRYYYDFRYYPGDERWQCTKSFTGFTVIDEGEIAKEKFTLRIIAYGDSFAIFIDGESICTFQDSDITGEENYFVLFGSNIKIDIDNLKYWNLDEKDF